MISTHAKHHIQDPVLLDALASNNRLAQQLLVLREAANASAVHAAASPIIFNTDVVKLMVWLQDELNEALQTARDTHASLVTLY